MRVKLRIPMLAVLVFLFLPDPAWAQADPIEAELDRYWAEMSRTVAEGDFEAMKTTYHPDGVHVSAVEGDAAPYRTRLLSDGWPRVEAGTAETRAGEKSPGLEFRFSSRVHNENTAHEVGIYRFWVTRPGEERVDAYGMVDSYLVKKDGRWMVLVEIQREQATKADWDALR